MGIRMDYWYLLFLILLPITLRKISINKWQIILYISIILGFVILLVFAPKFSLVSYLNDFFKLIHLDQIKKSMVNFFDRFYDKETSSFIKLILFNIRSEETIIFYKQAVDLGIVWLIGISGFHVSLLSRTIKLIFKKIPKVGWYINLFIIGFYSFLLDFSYASQRVWLKLCLQPLFQKFKIVRYEKLGWIGLIICLLNPICFSKIGFLLSFSICFGAYFVGGLDFNNKIISSISINVLSFVISIPFVIMINHKIAVLTFINAFIFSYFSSFIFLYFLCFAWMPFLWIIHKGIAIASFVLVGNISFNNIFIYSKEWLAWQNAIYFIVLTGLLKVVYLIVFNNKI